MRNIRCDRCGKTIDLSNEMVRDFINTQYPGKDICENCELEITLGSALNRADLINNKAAGTTVKEMLDLYK